MSFALTNGSFDGGDQGLLNDFFNNWRDLPAAHRLPFIYNMTAGSFYSYPAAYKRFVYTNIIFMFNKYIFLNFRFGAATKIVHFIGSQKPWTQRYVAAEDKHGQYWNQLYSTKVTEHQVSLFCLQVLCFLLIVLHEFPRHPPHIPILL